MLKFHEFMDRLRYFIGNSRLSLAAWIAGDMTLVCNLTIRNGGIVIDEDATALFKEVFVIGADGPGLTLVRK
jgi:hypothetical protein